MVGFRRGLKAGYHVFSIVCPAFALLLIVLL